MRKEDANSRTYIEGDGEGSFDEESKKKREGRRGGVVVNKESEV